ncbi:hypothetical protein T459_34257 [Capsicum annuum]|uniref:Uncharacterized protein n=1 Tax=Capsicum annuum TaxID=4072 RepID=A0A2G2XWL2_CAPAN|nr:hypothetical protein T459_34257 [Capsicum annuum]
MFPKVVQDNAQPNISDELLENARIISQESALGSQGAPSYRVFSMKGLEEVTEKFDKSALLGEGSIGQVPMATGSVDVLERIASQLFTTSHEQQFNEEEIQVVSYPNKLFADMKSEPLSDASVPNMDVVINAPISGGISLMPPSLSQVDTSIFQQLPEEFLAKLKYELLCNSKIAIIQLGFCILTLTELQCKLLDTPNEQLCPRVSGGMPRSQPMLVPLQPFGEHTQAQTVEIEGTILQVGH